jgi:valyl-tRNA synthetase
VDAGAEKVRLKKEKEGLQKAIASKERQLEDETFRNRAPERIIKGLEATLAQQKIELEKLQRRLGDLDGGSSQAAGT